MRHAVVLVTHDWNVDIVCTSVNHVIVVVKIMHTCQYVNIDLTL